MCRYLVLKNETRVLSFKIPDNFLGEHKIIHISDDQELSDFLKSEYRQNPDLNFSVADHDTCQVEKKSTPLLLSLKHGDYYFVHKQEDIKYIEASGSYSVITLLDGHAITFTFNLSEIEPRLSGEIFVRVHRSVILNINYITKFIGNTIFLNKNYFPVGRKYKKALISKLNLLGNTNRLFQAD